MSWSQWLWCSCVGGGGLCKKESFADFFSVTTTLSSRMIQLNRTTVWKEFPNIFPNIWPWKSDPLNILSSVWTPWLKSNFSDKYTGAVPVTHLFTGIALKYSLLWRTVHHPHCFTRSIPQTLESYTPLIILSPLVFVSPVLCWYKHQVRNPRPLCNSQYTNEWYYYTYTVMFS